MLAAVCDTGAFMIASPARSKGWEPWCAELEVFHNPFARHPLPTELLPEASHWLEVDGAMDCRHYYDTDILWSHSLIMAADDPMPTYETLPAWLEDLARRRAARE